MHGALDPIPLLRLRDSWGLHWLKMMGVASNLIMQQIWWVKICCMIEKSGPWKWAVQSGRLWPPMVLHEN
jgi:hypothetical protein